MSSAVRAIASRTLALTTVAVLGLGSTAVAAAGSIDELNGLNLRAWSGETELLSKVYAPDGMHTATYYDLTTEFPGPDRIASVAGSGSIELIAPRVDIPAGDGDWRWATFHGHRGGTACLFRAIDGMITRHDCLLPKRAHEGGSAVGLADAEASAAIDEVLGRLRGSWGPSATVERLAEVYAPDAVHTARYLNTTKRYTGPEGILEVARNGSQPNLLGGRVDFEAPEGELAWAEVIDSAGGIVCLFRAVDNMITRHDCVLPISG